MDHSHHTTPRLPDRAGEVARAAAPAESPAAAAPGADGDNLLGGLAQALEQVQVSGFSFGDGLDAVKAFDVRVVKIINNDNLLIHFSNQFNDGVASDIAGPTGNKNFHFRILPFICC